MRKETKFLLRNVDRSVHKTASTLFSSDWDGKPHSIGYLVAGTDMNKERDSGKLLDYINRDRYIGQGKI